ncbi:MAG: hypothetical protein ABIP93_08035 [Gemmatimonadaceae bacterium]
MAPLEFLSGAHTVRVLGHTLSLGPNGIAAIVGWFMFASSALNAARQGVSGARFGNLPRLAGAGATLAAMSAGLGLLLMDSYPDFARTFCLPYALLAIVAAVIGRAMQAGGRTISEE